MEDCIFVSSRGSRQCQIYFHSIKITRTHNCRNAHLVCESIAQIKEKSPLAIKINGNFSRLLMSVINERQVGKSNAKAQYVRIFTRNAKCGYDPLTRVALIKLPWPNNLRCWTGQQSSSLPPMYNTAEWNPRRGWRMLAGWWSLSRRARLLPFSVLFITVDILCWRLNAWRAMDGHHHHTAESYQGK